MRSRATPVAAFCISVLAPALSAETAGPARPPCAACVTWESDVVRVPLAGADADSTARRVLESPTATLVIGLGDPPLARDRALFDLQGLATAVRAAAGASRVTVALEGPPALVQELLGNGAAPYVDAVVTPSRPRGDTTAEWWRRHDGPLTLPALLEATRAGPDRVLVAAADPGVAGGVAALARWFGGDLAPFGEVRVSCDGCVAETFLRPDLSVVALVRGPSNMRPEALLVQPSARRTEVLPVADGLTAVLVQGWRPPDEVPPTTVEVHARAALSVGEIVARHRAAAAAQARAVRSLIAEGTLVLTFQAPGVAAPMVITADTRLFQAPGLLELAQADLRLNGLAVPVRGGGVPALPLLDAERAHAAPLAIVLGERFRYRLDGVEAVQGTAAYRVTFAPAPGRSSVGLPRGTAWIAAEDFGLARLEIARGDLKGPIVSSRQQDTFVRVPLDGGTRAAWLLARSEVHQAYEGAAHRTPVHRVLELARHEVNPADFADRRAAAHASDSVMVQDTPAGFRYLERAAPASDSPPAGGRPGPAAPLRRLAGPATRVRTLAAGLLVDPDIDRALPFAGLGYADLDVLGTGAQLDLFLAGPFARAALSTPRLGGSGTRAHLRLFASLVEYNHRAFRGGRERYEENLRQQPRHATLALARPLGAVTRARLEYELAATPLGRGDSTAPDFRPPPGLVVHTLRPALERDLAGWTLGVWGALSRRARWRAWGGEESGATDGEAAAARTYHRGGVSAARPFVLSPRAAIRLDFNAVAGHDLDRFSRFAFDGLDDRLRGYPSAALRFDRGAALRTAVAVRPHPAVRLDAFLDGALVHAPDDPGRRAHAGAGIGVQGPLPGHFLASVEWGYGFRAPRREGGQGAHVLRATVYRIF